MAELNPFGLNVAIWKLDTLLPNQFTTGEYLKDGLSNFQFIPKLGQTTQEGIREVFRNRIMRTTFVNLNDGWATEFLLIIKQPGVYALDAGKVITFEKTERCREVSAQAIEPWPTSQMGQAFGIPNWQQHPKLSKPAYWIKVEL